MKEHYPTVPYYNEERRIRVLLKDYDKEEWVEAFCALHARWSKYFSTVKSLFRYSWKIIPTLKTIKNFQNYRCWH